MPKLKIGIFIIGSLLWESDPKRQRWRTERLNMTAQQQVRARTRYGRISSSRKCTYTMVFSTSTAPSTAIVVPCCRAVSSIDDLRKEARALAVAEGLGDKEKWLDFGAVGILLNPQSLKATEFLPLWRSYFSDHINADCEATRKAGRGENPSLSTDGQLNTEWPICNDLGTPNDCDILLATANAPDLNNDGTYPNAHQIAERCLDKRYTTYFSNNVRNGIFTADDPDIWAHIKKGEPSWIARDEFEEIDAALAV